MDGFRRIGLQVVSGIHHFVHVSVGSAGLVTIGEKAGKTLRELHIEANWVDAAQVFLSRLCRLHSISRFWFIRVKALLRSIFTRLHDFEGQPSNVIVS